MASGNAARGVGAAALFAAGAFCWHAANARPAVATTRARREVLLNNPEPGIEVISYCNFVTFTPRPAASALAVATCRCDERPSGAVVHSPPITSNLKQSRAAALGFTQG